MTDHQTEKLRTLDTDKLIDVVKNYRQYGYSENIRLTAISILESRGISKEQLQLTGNYDNKTYDRANELYHSFSRNSKRAFVLYGLVLFISLLTPFLYLYSESLETVFLLIKAGAGLFYFIFLLQSFLDQSQFYKATGQDYGTEGALLYLFLGIPFYLVLYFLFRTQMKNKMAEIK